MMHEKEEIIWGILTQDENADFNVKYANLLLSNKFKKINRKPFKGIKDLLKDGINIHGVFDAGFINPEYDFKQLDGIGKKIALKCRTFYSELTENIIEFSQLTPVGKKRKYNKELFFTHFKIKECPEEILSGETYFSFMKTALEEGYFFSARDAEIYSQILKIFKDDVSTKSHKAIGFQYGLTSERVRQLGQVFFDKIAKISHTIDDLELGMCMDELIDDKDLVYLNKEKLTHCSDKGVRAFNPNFVTFILSLYRNDYALVGNYKYYILDLQFSNRHAWKYIYMVNKEITDLVDLDGIIQYVFENSSARVPDEYKINLKELLKRFRHTEIVEKMVPRIMDILSQIMDLELGLKTDDDYNVTIRRNTYLLIWEYAYDALAALDEPSYLDTIVEKMYEMFPGNEFNPNSVRSSMITQDAFIHIGRKSMYGLKRWEDEKRNFKGGTIRDIVEEYISKNGGGLHHIDKIAEHVLQFRPGTTRENIYSNLLLEKNNRFTIPKPGYVGIGDRRKEIEEQT